MASRLRVWAIGPITSALVAAVDTLAVTTRNVATDTDQIARLEIGDTLADRIHLRTHFVHQDGGPLLNARQADIINHHI